MRVNVAASTASSAPLRFPQVPLRSTEGSTGQLRTAQEGRGQHRHAELAFLIVDSLCDESRVAASGATLAATTEDQRMALRIINGLCMGTLFVMAWLHVLALLLSAG